MFCSYTVRKSWESNCKRKNNVLFHSVKILYCNKGTPNFFFKKLVSLKFVLIFLAVLKPTFQPKQCLFLMFVLIVYISSSYCGCIRSRCSGLKGLRGELRKTINILRISSRLLAASAYRAVNYTVSMVIFRYFSNFATSSFITCIIISKNIYYTECVLSCC